MVGTCEFARPDPFAEAGQMAGSGWCARSVRCLDGGAGRGEPIGIGRRRMPHRRKTAQPGPDLPDFPDRQRRCDLLDRAERCAGLLPLPSSGRGPEGSLPQFCSRIQVFGDADWYFDPVRFQGDLHPRPGARLPHLHSEHLTRLRGRRGQQAAAPRFPRAWRQSEMASSAEKPRNARRNWHSWAKRRGEIRTPVTPVRRTTDFETAAFNRSAPRLRGPFCGRGGRGGGDGALRGVVWHTAPSAEVGRGTHVGFIRPTQTAGRSAALTARLESACWPVG
jgi:hypothetical protein